MSQGGERTWVGGVAAGRQDRKTHQVALVPRQAVELALHLLEHRAVRGAHGLGPVPVARCALLFSTARVAGRRRVATAAMSSLARARGCCALKNPNHD